MSMKKVGGENKNQKKIHFFNTCLFNGKEKEKSIFQKKKKKKCMAGPPLTSTNR